MLWDGDGTFIAALLLLHVTLLLMLYVNLLLVATMGQWNGTPKDKIY